LGGKTGDVWVESGIGDVSVEFKVIFFLTQRAQRFPQRYAEGFLRLVVLGMGSLLMFLSLSGRVWGLIYGDEG
ncbi:MAG TPA: hypothetical protein DD000_24035, partial [Cyanobacteria bacterium UBA11166]|nr:hypothetical protein [Cyanobacteria bacterium UBA11166]